MNHLWQERKLDDEYWQLVTETMYDVYAFLNVNMII